MASKTEIAYSVCPHDCPSTCGLEVEIDRNGRVGRLRGAKSHSYTAGVICAKVARYSERIHHPDRLMHPLARTGPKGSGRFKRISWDEALDITGEALLEAERRDGPQAVWPYYYAGTMGLLMRDGINRLRHAKGYSRQDDTICSRISHTGFSAGTGACIGPDPREMAKSDLVVIWGTNPVNTQVNVMTHATRARKERGAKLVAIDVYNNGTMRQADLALCLRPGTDGALACAIMHVLFRDDFADWSYLEKYTDRPHELRKHVEPRDPAWASEITGLSVEEIETLAGLIGRTPRTYLRLGYGFTRSRNGAVNMHAASCIAAITGAWQHEGGGAFHNNGAIYGLDRSLIHGSDVENKKTRIIDMSRIGPALTGDPYDLAGGPPVAALFIQNMNPVCVAPEQNLVKAGFARDDLFVCVHEQFMTETAKMADIVLPATMFLEHDDIYVAGGHQHLSLGPKSLEAPGECRSNHEVICDLAKRVGARHRGFEMSAREIIDETLRISGYGGIDDLAEKRWRDCQPDFETSHYLNGFNWPDKKFRFSPDWPSVPIAGAQAIAGTEEMPEFPDHWDILDAADGTHPFRLVTAPARAYLNSSFTETASSRDRHGAPTAHIHPLDLEQVGVGDADFVRIGNARGAIELIAKPFEGVQRGVIIIESIPPNHHFTGGIGLNSLTSADQVAPYGGAPFHDTKVWLRAGTNPAA